VREVARESGTASATSSLEQFPEWFIRWHHIDKINSDELFGDNYSFHGTLFPIYSQSEALQYFLLMRLMLIITILVSGIAT
jgi:hypothetical protein